MYIGLAIQESQQLHIHALVMGLYLARSVGTKGRQMGGGGGGVIFSVFLLDRPPWHHSMLVIV